MIFTLAFLAEAEEKEFMIKRQWFQGINMSRE